MTSPSTSTEGSLFVSTDLRVWERRWWGWKFLGIHEPHKNIPYPYEKTDHIEDIVDGVKK